MENNENEVQGDQGGSSSTNGGRNLGANHSDPLFLSNSDHPGMVLVSTQFNGANFHSWSRAVRMALGAKMKLGFINGKVEPPSEVHEDYDRWLRCDYMVTSWILNSMKSDLEESFVYMSSANNLWEDILERFAESNAPLVYQIKKEIYQFKQDNLSVGDYYSKRKKAWDELMEIESISICKCGVLKMCSCGILKKLVERDATTRVMQFLMGLSDTFEGIQSQILSMDPLSYVNRAFHMVLQIERQKGITGTSSRQHEVLATRSFTNPNNNGKASSGSQASSSKSNEQKKDNKKAKMNRSKIHFIERIFASFV